MRKALQNGLGVGHFLSVLNLRPIKEPFLLVLIIGSVLIITSHRSSAFYLGMLSENPDWSSLDIFQKSMTREEFVEALETVYLPYGYDEELITVYPGYALIRENGHEPDKYYRYDFAPWGALEEKNDGPPSTSDWETTPLEGLVIAIDPGHIGGTYSEMERRHFQLGNDAPVKEGDLTLLVAEKLATRLLSLGAKPVLLRSDLQPVTEKRPSDFEAEAAAIEQQFWLDKNEFSPGVSPWDTRWFKKRVQERKEMLFYRVSEIQARAKLLNETIKPDLTLAIHFNVAPWSDATHQNLPEENHVHVLVGGTYMPAELALDDVRFHLFKKLVSRNHELEIPISDSVVSSLLAATGLPPFTYQGLNASNQGNHPGLWARNLLANRLYEGPVVFLEAYCTNSESVYHRVQLGDYEGLRDIDGIKRPSLYQEYINGIVEGLVDYYSQAR